MATYNDKQKLIDENQDLFISEYDKTLNYDSLSKIIDQKKKYKNAQKDGDTKGMTDANNKANSIRHTAGSYSGGYDGSEYSPLSKKYETLGYEKYESPYSKEKDKLLKKISNMEDFSYDYEKDPVFKAYYSLYQKLGDDAYERALSENSMRTGGMISSSAMSAALMEKNRYNSMISQKLPELFNDAYSRYKDEYEILYDKINLLSDLDAIQYERFRDDIRDFESERDYYYIKERDTLNRILDTYKFDSDMEYEKERDAVSDFHWNEEFDQTSEKNNLTGIINLAKSLYGKTPISASVISSLYSMIK